MTDNRTLKLVNTPVPWLVGARFPYDEKLKNLIKQWPGSKWETPADGDFGPKQWLVPSEMVSDLFARAVSAGWQVKDERTQRTWSYAANRPVDDLYKHQAECFDETYIGLAQTNAWLLNLAMRLGKTPIAIRLAQAMGYRHIVVICPAMVRQEWARAFDKWWPEHPPLWVHEPGPVAKKWLDEYNAATIDIVSYGQLPAFVAAHEGTLLSRELLIADEAHYLQNPKAKQTKAAFALARQAPKAQRLALTGTVVTTHLESMHNVLDWLWPNRFGTVGSFKFRYLISEEVYDKNNIKRGLKYLGLRDDTKAELQRRLSLVSSRRTKLDVPALFPPLTVELIQTDDKPARLKELVEALQGQDESVGIMSYERAMAAAHADTYECPLIYGGDSADARDTLIEALRLKAATSPVTFSATISSTREGLNLSFCSNFIYTQLSDKIFELVQSFARGTVMGGRSVSIYLLVDPSQLPQAERIKRKVSAVNEIIKAGMEEQGLATATNLLKEKGYTDAEWAEAVSMVLGSAFNDGSEVIEK